MGLELSAQEVERLQWIASHASSAQIRKARILLASASGASPSQIASEVGITPRRIRYWVRRFESESMGIFPEGTEPARPGEPKGQKPPDQDEGARRNRGQSKPRSIREQVLAATWNGASVKPDQFMVEAGRGILLDNLRRMLMHEGGARSGTEAEDVHKMHVAVRRLRTALGVFRRYDKGALLRRYASSLKKVGKSLGPLRDLDVLLQKAIVYSEQRGDQPELQMEPVLDHLRRKRQSARKKLIRQLDKKRYNRMVDGMGRFLLEASGRPRDTRIRKRSSDRVYHAAPLVVYRRYRGLRKYGMSIDSAPMATLHSLRIECKRFRYTLEFFEGVLGPQATAVIELAVTMQDLLGALHDADVASRLLIDTLETWKESETRTSLDARGASRYLATLQDEIHEALAAVPGAWSRMMGDDMRRDLANAIAEL